MNYRGVYGGTPVGTGSKCDSCIHARVIRGYAESERIVLCDWSWREPMRITFKVRECSNYADKRLPDVEEMKEVAWMLVSKSAGKTAGFISAADFKKLEDETEDSS